MEDNSEAFLESLPVGFLFKPRDDELVGYYLMRKVYDRPLPSNPIKDVRLYKYDPDTLTAGMSSNEVTKEWYFFTPRDRKDPHGNRPKRSTGNGFWKATSGDDPVKCKGKLIGMKKTLVFWQGKPGNAKKTNWIMHEYVLVDSTQRTNTNDTQLDKWVLCRLHRLEKGLKHQTHKPAEEAILPPNNNLNFTEADRSLLYTDFDI